MSCSCVGKQGGRLWGRGLGAVQRARLLQTEGSGAGPFTFPSVFCAPSSSCLSCHLSHRDPLPGATLVFKNSLFGLVNFPSRKMISFYKIWFLVTLPLGWFKGPKTEGIARVRDYHLSEGVMLPEQHPFLGPLMSGEPSFPISPKGSKAPKSSDLRGHAKFKINKCVEASFEIFRAWGALRLCKWGTLLRLGLGVVLFDGCWAARPKCHGREGCLVTCHHPH